MIRTFFFLTVLALAAGAAHAQVYRWVDEQGRVRYTDTPPPASAKGSRTIKPGASAKPAAPPPEQKPAAAGATLPEAVLYTNSGCGQLCADARAHLLGRSVKFREIEVESPETLEQLRKATGGLGVPALVIGGAVQNGYDAAHYDRMLDSARFPKAAPAQPAARPQK